MESFEEKPWRKPGTFYVQNNLKSCIFCCLWIHTTTHFYCLSYLNYFSFWYFILSSLFTCCPFPFLLCSCFCRLLGSHLCVGGVGVFLQERISLITLTMALMKTHGRHIAKNRRGCEWDSRSLQSARWPARSPWEQFLHFNVNALFLFFFHPGLLTVYTLLAYFKLICYLDREYLLQFN